MARDDSVLNTGMSSAVDRKNAERVAKRKEEQANKRQALTTDGEIITAWIDKEIAKAKDLSQMIINISSEKHVTAQLLGRQYQIKSLETMKAKAKNILRTGRLSQVRVPESEKSEAQKAFEAEAKDV